MDREERKKQMASRRSARYIENRAGRGKYHTAEQREARIGSQTARQTGVRKAAHCAGKAAGGLTGTGTAGKRTLEESRDGR